MSRSQSFGRGPASYLAIAAAAGLVAACGNGGEGNEQSAETEASGTLDEAPAVPLVDTSGTIIGSVRGGDGARGATLLVEARGLPPGEHGFHIHDVGMCETPDFTSAGSHWNPTGAQHGGENPQGAHMGDLQNVMVGEDGNLRTEVIVPGTYLRNSGRNTEPGAVQILDDNGAALVIHAKADDYRTDPSGDAGDRIACAVLGAPGTTSTGASADGTAGSAAGSPDRPNDGNAVANNLTGAE